jgi:outer membrane protein assembly factor BamA
LGIIAPSLAQINSSNPYSLRSVTLGLGTDTRDDFTNPRRGYTVSLGDEYSSSAFGSAFDYSIYTLDASRFFTVFHSATLGIHARIGDTTGAIPTNKLYTFSDQQLRGYSNPYYGTDMRLFQAELRIPLTSDRKIAIVPFVDDGAMRIRGGQQIDQTTSTVTDLSTYVYHADVGLGIRFDVPQLGLKTIRLDFAHGSLGSHTSFGIGQSF